jgi:hypothetical protein
VRFGSGEALVDLVPVDGVPPGGEVVWALVLVLEVVGVLPDVVAEDGVVGLSWVAVGVFSLPPLGTEKWVFKLHVYHAKHHHHTTKTSVWG